MDICKIKANPPNTTQNKLKIPMYIPIVHPMYIPLSLIPHSGISFLFFTSNLPNLGDSVELSLNTAVTELHVDCDVSFFSANFAVTRSVDRVQSVNHSLAGDDISVPRTQSNLLVELQVHVGNVKGVQSRVVLGFNNIDDAVHHSVGISSIKHN